MIKTAISWLGRLIGSFFLWLGGWLWKAFQAIIDALQTFINWLFDIIIQYASELLTFVLEKVPSDFQDNANFIQTVTYIRSAWNTFDDFVPLSEGLVFVTIFFSFYFTVKLTQFVIRVVLALIP